MKKIIKSVLFIPLLSASLTGCNTSHSKIVPSELVDHIIDDNYRNWYEIFVGSFYDSNGDGMGDLNGVTSKLDYIKDTGYNGIWLMPIFKSSSYHKYNTSDYYSIDSSYGTSQDLQNLIDACHQKGIRLILDLVLNHSSKSCSYFNTSTKAYAKYLSGQELSQEENEWKDVYSFSPTSKTGYASYTVDGQTFYYECNFDSDMPEFNFDSQKARNLLKDIMSYYLNLGVDGFRLDAVKYYYYGNTSKNCEVLNDFYQEAKTINPNAYFVGECWDSASVISSYYASSNIDSYFYFPSSNEGTDSLLKVSGVSFQKSVYLDLCKKIVSDANGHIPAPFIDNHDMNRAGSTNDNKYKYTFALLSMLNGGTYHYYGDEIGLTGTKPPDQNVRTYMYWDEGNFTGKCYNPGGTSQCSYTRPSLKTQQSDSSSVYHFIKQTLKIRNAFPSIARGNIDEAETKTFDDNELMVLQKTYQDETIRIVFNNSITDSFTYDYSDSSLNTVVAVLNVLQDQSICSIGNQKINLPPYSIAVIK